MFVLNVLKSISSTAFTLLFVDTMFYCICLIKKINSSCFNDVHPLCYIYSRCLAMGYRYFRLTGKYGIFSTTFTVIQRVPLFVRTFGQKWAKLRVAMLPTVIVLEPLSECMVIGACAAWAVRFLFSWEPLVFYLIHILAWFLCDWMLLSIVQNGTLPFKRFDFIIGWLFRECSGPYLFLVAVFDPTIKWRNRVFKLAWGGIVQEIKPRIKC